LPVSQEQERISLETLLTVVVVIIFALAASLSAYCIIQENKDLRAPRTGVNANAALLESSFDNFESHVLTYLSGEISQQDAAHSMRESFDYLRNVHASYLKRDTSSTSYPSFNEALKKNFFEMEYLIKNMEALPEDEIRRQMLAEIVKFRQTMQAAPFTKGTAPSGPQGMSREHIYLFSSVVVMGISGLGLIALLLHKINTLESAYQKTRSIMSLLEPRMAAVESSKDGIGITDADGNISYVNHALAKHYGFNDASELIGESWTMLYSPQQAEWMEAEVMPILKQEGHWQGHCTGLRRDGTEFYQDMTMTFLENRGWVWIVRDYSEMMETMMVSNRRLAAIEAAGDGIGLVDREGKLTYINKALMNLHGIQPEELDLYIGQPWSKLYSIKGQTDINEQVMPILRSTGHWKGEAPIRRTDNRLVFAEMSLTLLPDGGLIGTARDITDRKQAEKEKEHLQKQFFQAQKMEAIGRLAGGIAHDFNNILASMLGYTEFLMEDLAPDTKQNHFARQIMHGGRQAQHLVEQILAFSRLKESSRARLDITEAIGETVTMLRATLPSTISLDLQINADYADINANATQISQILMNLCVNARDAMHDERGILKIAIDRLAGGECPYSDLLSDEIPEINYTPASRFVHTADESTVLLLGFVAAGAPYIRVSVEDTGCGMNRAVMEQIFEPFFTTKDIDKGTGLGLSTVHGMAAGHQAAIVVRSVVNKGTRFDVWFPAADESVPGQNAIIDDHEAVQGASLAGRKILLVEDETTVREMLTQMLKRFGCMVESCNAGDLAIDHLREHPGAYDLVLSDHMMPNLTGVEMSRELHFDFPDLPIVLISGYSPKKLEDAMAENPSIRAVLKKPVTGRKLREALQEALADRSAAA
jgi:PAS domain S-box-containing protein